MQHSIAIMTLQQALISRDVEFEALSEHRQVFEWYPQSSS